VGRHRRRCSAFNWKYIAKYRLRKFLNQFSANGW
jgi:hypothetical protein